MKTNTIWRAAVGGLMAVGVVAALGTGSAHADLRTTYQAGPIVYPGAGPDYPQQGAVNKNIGSPYYGYFYVADYGGGVGPHKMIHIWKPTDSQNGTGAAAYEDTGLVITPSGTGQFDPFAVAVGSDDTVWIGNYTTGTIDAAPPVPASPATSVTATAQITGAGSVRGLFVSGPISNVTIVAAGTTTFVEKYTGSAPNPSTPGVFTQVYKTTVTGLNSGPYGPAMDTAGNAYIVTKTAAPGEAAFIKLDPTGTVVPFAATIPPNFPATSDLSSAGFVADASYPGGGYLYGIYRTLSGTAPLAADEALRFDLNGNYLDGYGPATTPLPANYTVLAIPRSGTYGDTDDLGNVYHKTTTGNGAYQKILKLAPFVVDAAGTNSASAAVKSSPTAVDGVVYFGDDSGKLYAYTTADGNPVPNFPLDISANVGTPVKIQSRPAVYITGAGKQIYFTTDHGHVGRVNADGTGLLVVTPPVVGANNTGTPAVTPDGTVYVGLTAGTFGSGIVKLDANLAPVGASASFLGGPGSTITSVAVNGSKVYVGLTGGNGGDIFVLNAMDLTVLGSFAATEGVTAPPFVSGADAYVGTLAGNFYKVNSITFAPDPTFGVLNSPSTPGKAAIGEPLPGSAFNDGALGGNTFYVGSTMGKVWQVNGTDGSFNVLYNTGNATASIPGVVVNRASSTLAFGTDIAGAAETDPHTGIFYQVPTDVVSGPVNAQVFRGYGAFTTTPTFDKNTGRFLIGSDDMNVYAFSSR